MTAPELSIEERAVVDRFEAAKEPAEIRVERVARAIFDKDNPISEDLPDYWERVSGLEGTHDRYRDLARTAITAMGPVR